MTMTFSKLVSHERRGAICAEGDVPRPTEPSEGLQHLASRRICSVPAGGLVTERRSPAIGERWAPSHVADSSGRKTDAAGISSALGAELGREDSNLQLPD